MVIKRSTAGEVVRLITDLSNDDETRREAAVARLAVIGRRAVDRLLLALPDAPAKARGAILRALEAIDDPRAASAVQEFAQEIAKQWSGESAMDALEHAGRALLRAASDAQPDDVRELVARVGVMAPLPTLQKAIERLREREAASTTQTQRRAWQSARAALHETLASRGSRVALYDLRETLEAANGALPIPFLEAAAAIGDETCLEGLARAYVQSTSSKERWWRERLAAVFRDIVVRRRLTRRHTALKRIAARWPNASALLPPSRRA